MPATPERGIKITQFPIPRTVKNGLVENLRDEIIRGGIAPGQRLRLEEIAARFDVSTMPVREALRDLEAEGLVTNFPHRGAVVTCLSADDLKDIYDVRTTLETIATRLAVPNMTEETLAELRSVVEQIDTCLGDVVTLVKLNHEFHSTLYAASGRRHLCELIRILRHRTQHYLHAYIDDLGGMPHAQSEHRTILEACRRGDVEQAASIIHDHVAQVGHAIIAYVRQHDETEARI
ncbi:MAG: GntR family transcriptional regulator [Anaerolineales bacterium]|nr:MAG: GntR family transcriptional regulator [Anaerolineales bacterium]